MLLHASALLHWHSDIPAGLAVAALVLLCAVAARLTEVRR